MKQIFNGTGNSGSKVNLPTKSSQTNSPQWAPPILLNCVNSSAVHCALNTSLHHIYQTPHCTLLPTHHHRHHPNQPPSPSTTIFIPLSSSIMGRSPCCEKAHTNKGAWTKEEDEKLTSYIKAHGEGCWRSLPKAAGWYLYMHTEEKFDFSWVY